jgi:hypothetical protein
MSGVTPAKGVDALTFTIPDGIEPILAYRAWSCCVDGIEPTLLPIAGDKGDVWNEASENWVRASCALFHWRSEGVRAAFEARGLPVPSVIEGDQHAAPAEGCSCGFYALKSASDVFERFGRFGGNLIGRVELAGKVIEHDLGFRAERARIDALIPVAGNEALTALVCASPRDRCRSIHAVRSLSRRPNLRLRASM